MSAGFPMGVVPGAPAQPQAAAGFVLNIPADPNWEPFETTDTLKQDGYYVCRVKGEKGRREDGKSPGLFLTLEVGDADERGRTLSKFLPDPNHTQGNTWWIWRSLIRSITGSLDTAKGAFQYVPGMFMNRVCWLRTEAYMDDGAVRTGVGAFVLQSEYDEAVAAGRHRWAAQVKPAGAAAVGALPGGLPAAFPGLGAPGGGGLPGAPSGGGVPRPTGAAPVQGSGFAPAATAPATVNNPGQQAPAFQAPPAGAPAFAPAPAAPAPAASGFAFPGQPAPAGFGAPAPAAPAFAAPPATNGAPQPSAPQPGNPFAGLPTQG